MTIAEVSKKYEITAATLRYYERIGLLPNVGRTTGGIRDYTESDCGWVEFIKCMRGAGVQVDALAEYVSLFQKGDATILARKQILLEQREKLLERMEDLQATLVRLDRKIERYEQNIVPAEQALRKTAG